MPFLSKRETSTGTNMNPHIDLPPFGFLYNASVHVRDANNVIRDGTFQILLSEIVDDTHTREYNLTSVELTVEKYGKGDSWSGKIPIQPQQQVRFEVRDIDTSDVMVLKVNWDRE